MFVGAAGGGGSSVWFLHRALTPTGLREGVGVWVISALYPVLGSVLQVQG